MRDLPPNLGVTLIKCGIIIDVVVCCSVGAVFLFAVAVAWVCN